jgi:hypothetical protein
MRVSNICRWDHALMDGADGVSVSDSFSCRLWIHGLLRYRGERDAILTHRVFFRRVCRFWFLADDLTRRLQAA